MEYRDVYTRSGKLKARSVPKHAPSGPGDYFRHVLVIMKTEDSPRGTGEGMYVVQQRSLKARYYAGKWDATGGAVQAGERLEAAAVRELQEELGIVIPESELKKAWDFIADWEDGTGLLLTVFGCRVHVPADGFRFDPREVNDVSIMPFHEFLSEMLDHNDDAFARELRKLEAWL